MIFASSHSKVACLITIGQVCICVGLSACGKSDIVTGSSRSASAASSAANSAVYVPENPGPVESYFIPAGTKIEVETMEAVDSDTNESGSFIPVTVYADVRGTDGKVGIPRNSSGIVVARSSTREGSISIMDLVLYQMSVGDHSYLITAPKSVAPGIILKEDATKGDGHRTVHLAKRTLLTFTLNQNLSLKR